MRKRSVVVAALSVASILIACGGNTLTRGEIVVAVQTDMSLPKDIDTIGIQVTTNGVVNFSEEYAVGQGNLLIPATFGVVQGSDPSQAVQIRTRGGSTRATGASC